MVLLVAKISLSWWEVMNEYGPLMEWKWRGGDKIARSKTGPSATWYTTNPTQKTSNLTNETNLNITWTTVVGNMQAYNKPMKMS